MDGEISGTDLEALFEEGKVPEIVDIRSPVHFRREHIKSSTNVPLDRLPVDIEQFADKDHVVTVCPHGKASVRAAELIASYEDFSGTVESLTCGLEGWEGPTDSETPPSGSEAPF